MIVNESLRTSLQTLSQRIEDAEKFLRKIPGAYRANYVVSDVHYFDDWFDGEAHCVPCLAFSHNNRFVIQEWAGDPDDHTIERELVLSETPVHVRIQVAAMIPNFINDAIHLSDEVAADAKNVADEIEQAIADALNEA